MKNRSYPLAFLALMLLVLTSVAANAQATRTWVSGVGDDVNPCSRTAPCKTFAGAISKTAGNGSINCLDPGAYGAVTITKSITIDCTETAAGILAAGTNGINVNGGGIVVTLRGLDIEGAGSGLVGINISQASIVYVKNVVIYGFQSGGAKGIGFTGGGKLFVEDSAIHSNGTGISADGSAGSIGLSLTNVSLHNNSGNGLSLISSGRATIEDTLIAFNGGTGINLNGSGMTGTVGTSTIFGNGTGVAVQAGILYSFKNNQIAGNAVDGTPLPIYPSAAAPHDFNADAKSDVLWRANTGDIAMWFMNGTTLQSGSGVGAIDPNWQIVKTPTGTSDFNGDGKADILWHHSNGSVALWLMNGATISSSAGLGAIDPSWQIAGVGDFNGDGKADILWRNTSGSLSIWFMNGTTISSSAGVGNLTPDWQVAGIADFNGDGKADIVLRNTTSGDVAVWLMNGATIASSAGLGVLPLAWQIVGTGDFNGDGKADILWRHSSGALSMWFMNGTTVASSASVGTIDPAWNVASTGDYDGNGKADIVWRSSAGDVAIWLMNGASIASSAGLGVLPAAWSIVE